MANRKYLYFIIILLSFCSCGKNTQVEISGTIDSGKYLYFGKIIDGNTVNIVNLKLDEKRIFSFSENNIYEGFYTIGVKKHRQLPLYIKPGENIKLHILEDSISFGDNISRENRLLWKWERLIRKFNEKSFAYPPNKFIYAMDSLKKEAQEISSSLGSSNFEDLLKVKMRCDITYISILYVGLKYDNPSYKSILCGILDVNVFDSNKILHIPNGSNMTLAYFDIWQNYFDEKYELRNALKLFSSNDIRAELLLRNAESSISSFQEYTAFNHDYSGYIRRSTHKKRLDEIYYKWQFSKPGSKSYDFKYPDREGNYISLSDFVGKLVVLDVWATWCAPCIEEMKYIAKIEHKFSGEDIVFLSVCVGANIEEHRWKKILEEMKPAGMHLFAGSWKSSIVSDYHIKGIPRFMLFDKNGNIITVNAPTPSSSNLEILIREHL